MTAHPHEFEQVVAARQLLGPLQVTEQALLPHATLAAQLFGPLHVTSHEPELSHSVCWAQELSPLQVTVQLAA